MAAAAAAAAVISAPFGKLCEAQEDGGDPERRREAGGGGEGRHLRINRPINNLLDFTSSVVPLKDCFAFGFADR